MPRIRSVHPDICTSETMAALSAELERTFVRLWTHCDDQGRCQDRIKILKASLYPEHDDVTHERLDEELSQLETHGLIQRYEIGKKSYIQVTSWDEYQKPQRASTSKYPPPQPSSHESSNNGDRALREPSASPRGGLALGGEGRGTGVGGEIPVGTQDVGPPLKPDDDKTLSETIAEWCKTNGLRVPPRRHSPQAAYRALVEHAEASIPSTNSARTYALTRLVREFIEEGADLELPEAQESHLRRLVKNNGALPVFDAASEAVIWGAGLDPRYAEDPLSFTKYVAGVFKKSSVP